MMQQLQVVNDAAVCPGVEDDIGALEPGRSSTKQGLTAKIRAVGMEVQFVRREFCIGVIPLLGEHSASDRRECLFWLGSLDRCGFYCGLFSGGELETLVHLMALPAAEVAGVVVEWWGRCELLRLWRPFFSL